MTVKRRSFNTLYDPKNGRPVKVLIWRNGDFETPGQELNLHPKNLKSWNSLLGFLTDVLQPRFGAIRKLYHLETKKLLFCLHDIKPNEKYVAVGAEKIKSRKNGYLTLDEKLALRTTNTSPIPIVDNSFMMAYTKKKKRTVVYFMVSGRTCHAPLKVVFIETDLLDYAMILEYLGHRLDIGEGIRYLCDVNAKPIENLSQLKHGELYVAVPFGGKFVRLDYHQLFGELSPIKTTKAKRVKRGSTEKAKSGKKKSSPSLSMGEDLLLKTESQEVKYQPCMSKKCLGTCVSLQTGVEVVDERTLTEQESLSCDLDTAAVALEQEAEVKGITCIIRDVLNGLIDDVEEVENRDALLAATSEKDGTEQLLLNSYRYGGVITKGSKTVDEIRQVLQSQNLTTFADLARNKPSCARGAPEVRLNRDLSLTGSSKKSVSFFNTLTPETISETDGASQDLIASEASFKRSSQNLPKLSILKVKINRNRLEHNAPQSFKYPPKGSFEHARDSIEHLPSVSLSKQLLEAFNAEGQDSLDSIDEQIVEEEPEVSEEDSITSRGVQKDYFEDLIDKCIQVASDLSYDPNRASDALFYSANKDLSDIYQNFEVDGVSVTLAADQDDIVLDTNSAPARCRREDCISFACSDICLKTCVWSQSKRNS